MQSHFNKGDVMTDLELSDVLEQLMDNSTIQLSGILNALVNICHEKSEHVLTNWQAKGLSKAWTNIANDIDTAGIAAKINDF